VSKPYIVVYGNCQAELLALAIRRLPQVKDQYLVRYVRNFLHPVQPVEPLPDECARNCVIYWRQYAEREFNSPDEAIPSGAQRIVFPPLDFSPLWPFSSLDTLFKSEPPEYPFGLFPYGDRLLKEISEGATPSDDIYETYNQLAARSLLDPYRHLDIEFERLRIRDTASNIKMASFVMSTFKSERLFWTSNHPTNKLFGELFDRLIRATWTESQSPSHPLYRIGKLVYRDWDPLEIIQVPVCDLIGRELGLRWWSADDVYDAGPTGKCTDAAYCVRYVTERRKRLTRPAETASVAALSGESRQSGSAD
jgi:hypothetical protein